MRVLLTVIFLLLPMSAFASCFNAPMWKGKPLTGAYITSQHRNGAAPERIALLESLLVSKKSSDLNRAEKVKFLISTALRYLPVDRKTKGKIWRSGDHVDLVKTIQSNRSMMRNLHSWLAEFLWLNGCVDEALTELEIAELRSGTVLSMFITNGNADAILNFMQDSIPSEENEIFLTTTVKLLTKPDASERAFQDLESSFLKGHPQQDLLPVVRLLLEKGELKRIQDLPHPNPEDLLETVGYLKKLYTYSVWSALAGDCDIAHQLRYQLLQLDDIWIKFFTYGVQSVNVMCAKE
ncbi:hypothetical protein [Planktotalea sp.]|uniref:hypothetical protein n=1 Tax=Planktotalea sp. TaxID=2029877 RepID=UPI003297B403